MDCRIQNYVDSQKEIWDVFVQESKNATFLFRRDYMDYHRSRFADYSLLVWIDDKLFAILPCSRSGNVLTSHGGLTYGGLLLTRDSDLGTLLKLFPKLLVYLKETGIETFIYKTIPHIYHTAPAEEDRYCLFRSGAMLYRTDVLTVLELRGPPHYQDRRMRAIQRATKSGLVVRETNEYEAFWEILATNLRERYGLNPVHSLDEIRLLSEKHPQHIRLYAAYENSEIRAGAVLYLTPRVCHIQYNAASPEGKKLGAQDFLFHNLIGRYSASHQYFDFGVSTEREGRDLNAGLVDYKEGFGGRCIAHDFFRLDLNSLQE